LDILEKQLLTVSELLPVQLRFTTFNFSFRRFLRIAKLCIKFVPPPASLLDVGCGVGTFALMMKQVGYKVSCVDHHRAEDQPWLLSNDILLKKTNLEDQSIPFADGAFQLVTCLDVIEHLHGSPQNMLREIHRVLSNNGFLCLETPNSVNLAHRVKVIFGKTNYVDLSYFYNSKYPYVSHFREYTPDELKKILGWSRFEVLNTVMFNTILDCTQLKKIDPHSSPPYDGEYMIGFKVNSLKRIMHLIFQIISTFSPNWRLTILVIGKKKQKHKE
jgi:2-polyprenyl-3-methyl-5-hydroxy-6-metoxy-1,4-benzoquinol methylase